MKKILLIFGTIISMSTPIITSVACSSKILKETNKDLTKSSILQDEEGFPIHKGTEIVPGEGDLSVARVINHLKKYLTIPQDGSNIIEVGLKFEKMGHDNIWDKWYLDEVDGGKSKWNSGNLSKDWQIFLEKDVGQYNVSNDNQFKEKEYVKKMGWKRFMKKVENQDVDNKECELELGLNCERAKWNLEFDILINAYPALSEPTKLQIKLIVVDLIYKGNIKMFELGIINNIVPSQIIHLKGNQKIAINESKAKQAIKDFADFKSWDKLLDFIALFKIINNDAIKHVLIKLNKAINEQFIKTHINKIYKLFVDSPYIDINNLPRKIEANNVGYAASLINDINKRNTLIYVVVLLADYIELHMA